MNLLYIIVFMLSCLGYISLVHDSTVFLSRTVHRLFAHTKEYYLLDGLGYFAIAYYKQFLRVTALPVSVRTYYGPQNQRIEIEIGVRNEENFILIEARRAGSSQGIIILGVELEGGLFKVVRWSINY